MTAYSTSLLRWLAPVIWGSIILVLSLMPGGPGGINLFGIPHFDKIGHFGMYAIWTFLITMASGPQRRSGDQQILWKITLFGSLAGILLEFGQYFMGKGRSFELADMVANALGAMAGVWIAGRYLRRKGGA